MSGLRWRNRHPVAFFFCCEVIGCALIGIGTPIEDAANRQYPPTQPGDGIGATMVGLGSLLVTVILIWGIVNLIRRSRSNARGGTAATGNPADGRKSAQPRSPSPAAKATAKRARADRTTRPPAARPKPRAQSPAERRVKVLMLGDSGSGKTTLLASLYHRFALGGAVGIRFTTDDRSNGIMQRLVARIRDPGEVFFTVGTRPAETKTWEFGVQVESGEQARTAFTVEYLDYPGGYVERRFHGPDSDPADPRFEQALAGADVLMGILDGEKISTLARGAYDVRAILAIENLLNILARAGQRNIHLVVTKWDLLRGSGGGFYSITELRDMLERESSAFRSFWENARFGSVRIIPVSALGVNGFVRPDASVSGGMTKVPGKPWEPWNVEVPFFCALPDILRHDVKSLSGKGVGTIAGMTATVLGAVGINIKFNVGFVSVNVPVTDIMKRVREYARGSTGQGKARASLTENKAIAYVLNQCFAHVDEFDRRFPDSRLRQPGANA